MSIILLLNNLNDLHKKTNFGEKNFINFYKNLFMFFISTILIRYNIINSIHNFITIEEQNQYYFYLLIIIIYFGFIICLEKKKIKKIFKINEIFEKKQKLFLMTLFLLIFVTIPFVSIQIKYMFVIYTTFIFSIFFKNNFFISFLIFFFKFSYFYIFMFKIFIVFFKKNYKYKLYVIVTHISLLIFIFILYCESYNQNFLNIRQNIILIKINSLNSLLNFFFEVNFFEVNFFKLKLYNYVNVEYIFNENSKHFINIFEKIIIISNNCIYEKHNCIFQEFLTTGIFMFILVFSIITFFITLINFYIFSKKIYILL